MTLPGHRKCRVIAVEDEALVLLLLQDMLTELGCEIAGSATRLDSALQLAIDGEFDLAILDVNLHGKRIDPIADAIAGRGLPIIFATGYGAAFPAERWAGQVLSKPYEMGSLRRALEASGACTTGRPDEPLPRL